MPDSAAGASAGTEKRTARVSVLYADISGFTALSERLDPEAVTDVINTCFMEVEAAVVARRGVIDRFIGDCVVAVFGLGVGAGGAADGLDAGASGAADAVGAAASIRGLLEDFHTRHGLDGELGIHVGIATGTGLLVDIGGEARRDTTLTGWPMTLASKLEEVSERGQIFVGPNTYAETSEVYEYRPLEPVALRGEAEPIPIYEYVGRRKSRQHVTRGSERRQATVVFASIRGFDDLSAHVDPERQTEILNLCFSALESAVRAYGGIIDKYIGATVMALFGVPNAIQDAPTQAINATIEMRKRLETLCVQERLPVTLQLTAGVNTGLVIAGDIGGRLKRDFTVMGDTVNLAARLKENGAPGQILIGPETNRYARAGFELADPVALTLKGKREPVPAYAVLSQRQRTHRALGSGRARLQAAMVGRDAELGAVRARLQALQGGRGGTLAIVGEAGVGKSRLTSELLALADHDAVTAITGRCQSVGHNLRFHPFVDLFRHWAHIEEDDTPEAAVVRLRDAIAAHHPGRTDEIFPFVATLMGLPLSRAETARLEGMEGDALEGMTTRAVRELLAAIATGHPLLLVFEDLHWADGSSLDLLEALLGLGRSHRLLFLFVCRPDFADTSDRLRAVARTELGADAVEILLEPLGDAQALALVQSLLGITDLPLALRTLITERTEGNPFFIEEVLLSLIESGAIERRADGFRIAPDLGGAQVPGTIQEVIMSRVDRLDPSTRQVLQIASVVGRSFFFSIMREVLRRHAQLDPDCERELDELCERDILLERDTGFAVPAAEGGLVQELEYVFRHALAQETIYESVLLRVRREHHQLVAETIEATFKDRLKDFYGMLAYHFGRAENLPKAEDYLFRAGEEASRAAASIEALAFFEKASQLYFQMHGEGGDPARKALLEKNIGLALLSRGRLTESIPHFDRALGHMGVHVPHGMLALFVRFARDFSAVLLHLYVLRGRRRARPATDADREFFQITGARARAAVTSDPDRIFFDNTASVRRMNQIAPETCDEACGLYAIAGALFSFAGISKAVGRRFLAIAQDSIRPHNVSHEFDCRHLEFNMNYVEGRWQADDLLPEELVERAIQAGLLWDVQTYLGLACDRLFRQGRFADARRQLDWLAELRDSYGYEFAASNHDGESAMFLLETRDLDGGLAQAERYLAHRHEHALQLLALGVITNLHVHRGDLEAAERALSRATEIRAQLRFIAPWHESTYALARLQYDVALLWRHRDAGERPSAALVRQAKRSRRAALANARLVAMNRVEISGLVGTLAWLTGDGAGAATWWRRAERHGEEMGALPELGRVCAAVARCLRGDGASGLDAAAYEARAARLAVDLDLAWDRRRLGLTPEPTSAAR
jgi:class 3 adenylate cyclase